MHNKVEKFPEIECGMLMDDVMSSVNRDHLDKSWIVYIVLNIYSIKIKDRYFL